MPAPDFERCRTQVTPRSTRATTITANAANFDRLAKMTPTTIIATKIQGQVPGSGLFGGGSVMFHPLLSIDEMDNE
jgi:hypothetical protein